MEHITFPEHKCPICGKTFIPTMQWAYKRRETYFCSWGCKRKDEAKHPPGDAAGWKKKITQAQKYEVYNRLLRGEKCMDIVDEMNVSVYAVKKIQKEMKEANLP